MLAVVQPGNKLNFSFCWQWPLRTAGLLEAAPQYSLREVCGSASTPAPLYSLLRRDSSRTCAAFVVFGLPFPSSRPDCCGRHSPFPNAQRRCSLTWLFVFALLGWYSCFFCWAEAPIKIARMTLTIKLDGNWSSFQLANSAPPLSVTDSAIAPSARMVDMVQHCQLKT